MPAVLDLLKRHGGPVKKSAIEQEMRRWIDEQGYTQPQRKISWALNRLRSVDYINNHRRGYWEITGVGSQTTLTHAQAEKIMNDCGTRERELRDKRRISK